MEVLTFMVQFHAVKMLFNNLVTEMDSTFL